MYDLSLSVRKTMPEMGLVVDTYRHHSYKACKLLNSEY